MILSNNLRLVSLEVSSGLHTQDAFFNHMYDNLIQMAGIVEADKTSLSLYMASLGFLQHGCFRVGRLFSWWPSLLGHRVQETHMAPQGLLTTLTLYIMQHHFFHIVLVRNESQISQFQRQETTQEPVCTQKTWLIVRWRRRKRKEELLQCVVFIHKCFIIIICLIKFISAYFQN